MQPNAFIRQSTFDKYIEALKSQLTLETDGLFTAIDADGSTVISTSNIQSDDPVPFEVRAIAGGVNVTPGIVTMQRSHLLGGNLIVPANAFWVAAIVIPMTLIHHRVETFDGAFGWREFYAGDYPFLTIIDSGSIKGNWSQSLDSTAPGDAQAFNFYVPIAHGEGDRVLGNSLPAHTQHHLSVIATTAGTGGGDALAALIKHD